MKGREQTRKIVFGSVITLLSLLVLGFIYTNARPYLSGPSITISSPEMYKTYTNPLLLVEGNVRYVTELTLNDRLIPITQEGDFFEYITLHPGYNVIEIHATDRFGREKSVLREITLVEKQSLTPTSTNATSSDEETIESDS